MIDKIQEFLDWLYDGQKGTIIYLTVLDKQHRPLYYRSDAVITHLKILPKYLTPEHHIIYIPTPRLEVGDGITPPANSFNVFYYDAEDKSGQPVDITPLLNDQIGQYLTVVESSPGRYHLYLKVDRAFSGQNYERIHTALFQHLSSYIPLDPAFRRVGVKGRNIRLPWSYNAKHGNLVKVLQYGKVMPADMVKGFLTPDKKHDEVDFITRLIIQDLEGKYIEGARHFLIGAISGFLRKRGFSYDNARQVIEHIVQHFDDPEPADRMRFLTDTYMKPLQDVAWTTWLERAEEVLRQAGIEPRFTFYHEIEAVPSLYVFQKSRNKLVAFFQDYQNGKILKVIQEKGEIVSSLEVAHFVIRKAEKLRDYLTGNIFYRVVVDYAGDTIEVIAPISEVADRLKKLPTTEDKPRRMLITIIEKMTEGAKLRPYIPVQGIVAYDERITFQHTRKPPTVEFDELKAALQLLNELSQHFEPEVFSNLAIWSVSAPFNFARKLALRNGLLKSNNLIAPHVLLLGASHSGKSTLSEIIWRFWGEFSATNEKTGAYLSSPARLGRVLGSNTFPVKADEVEALFRAENSSTIDILKNSYDSLTVRGVLTRTHEETIYYALAPMVMTTNNIPQLPSSIQRRLLVMRMDVRKTPSKQFQSLYSQAGKLKAIGYYVLNSLIEHEVKVGTLDLDWFEFGKRLLVKLYDYATGEIPNWLQNAKPYENDILMAEEDLFLETLVAYIDNMAFYMVVDGKTFEAKLKAVATKRDIGLYRHADTGRYFITTGFLRNMSKFASQQGYPFEFPTLESVAQRFNLLDKLIHNTRIKIDRGGTYEYKGIRKALIIDALINQITGEADGNAVNDEADVNPEDIEWLI